MISWRDIILSVIALSMLSCGVAQAELRLLIAFDDSGHIVKKVYSTSTRNTHDSQKTKSPSVAATVAKRMAKARNQNGIDPRSPIVTWYNSGNDVLSHENFVDPRTAHAPLGLSSEPHHYFRTKGVYMLTAPNGAVRIQLRLPELALDNIWAPAEQWDLSIYTPQ